MNFKHLFLTTVIASIITLACAQQESTYTPKATFNTMEDSVSYAIGYQNGSQLGAQGFPDVDVENFMAGFISGLEKEDSKLDGVNLQSLFNRFSIYLVDKIKLENAAEAKAFFAENKTKEGVIETTSGLQYKVLVEGTGKQPTAEDRVVVYYEGTLLDGTVFESNFDGEPAENVLGGFIPGWIEGVGLMKEGATYMLYIPSELGYGENPRPGGLIQPNHGLIFKIELVEVK